MSRIKLFLLAGCAIIILLVGCREGKQYNILRPNDVVLAFGNSLTHGTGAAAHESYPARLEDLIRRKVINAGVPGEVTAEGLRRLPAALDEHEPDLLILCHGGNDMLRRHDKAQTITNLKAMIAEAQSRDIPVVMLAVPQLGLLLDPAPFYSDIAKEFNVPIEEAVISDILTTRDLKSDSIHPNAAGYKKMAESVADLLKKSGAI
jgi:lysophospholipase L1-like esterase